MAPHTSNSQYIIKFEFVSPNNLRPDLIKNKSIFVEVLIQ